MKIIDKKIIQQLYLDAEQSPRKRAHYLLHKSHQSKVQRLYIGLVQGSYVEPHYHEKAHQWEMMVVLEGLVKLNIYDEDGKVINSFFVGSNDSVTAIELQPLDIHSLECISEKALLLEIKEGPFNPAHAQVFI